MKIIFITPASGLRRLAVYRLVGKVYGQSNSITGPLILGHILKEAGHDVSVYEELNGSVDYKKIIAGTDVFAFSIMASNAPRAYELADLIHEKTDARVIMGGIHATYMYEEALLHADQVIVGEGEQVILDVIEGRMNDRVIYGKICQDLDAVPFPDYSILKTPCECANILSTRGCPYRCTFCITSRMFAPYRQRSVESVMDEIRMYHGLGFKYMNFEDDNFTADKKRAKEICRKIIEEHLQFKETFFFGRTDIADDEELLELLEQAHFTRVLIGIESLNQASLDAIHKGQKVDQIRRAGSACKKHHIRMIASIVLGLDDDSKEDIYRSLSFAKSIDAYQLQPAILTPFPGTPIYEKMIREDRMLTDNWECFDMMNVTFHPKRLSPWELQETFYYAAKYFYDFKSSLRIRRLYGREYGWRRFWLAVFARLGSFGAHVASKVKGSPYYKIRNVKWKYAR